MDPAQHLQQVMDETHNAHLYNNLMKTQHRILLQELAKIETLDGALTEARERRKREHDGKMAYYGQVQALLEEEIRKKD